MHWLITDKGDLDAKALAECHYTRQTPNARSFTRNGQNLVFITNDCKACWVTFRPTPGKAKRSDDLDAWECTLFRNVGSVLSSILIKEAVKLSWALWGNIPPTDGIITFVKPECIKSDLPGYCFRRAGWKHKGNAKDGKPRFKAPKPKIDFQWKDWQWKESRGGKLRLDLEYQDNLIKFPPCIRCGNLSKYCDCR